MHREAEIMWIAGGSDHTLVKIEWRETEDELEDITVTPLEPMTSFAEALFDEEDWHDVLSEELRNGGIH
jgi:hypothetical protein